MKRFNYLFVIVILFTTISCKNEAKSTSKTTEQITSKEELQNVEINIEGMTCEIGCAKLIESKVYKLEGVKTSKVSFENKIGTFTFDENKISLEEIVKKINGIAGGELYKVTDIKMLTK